jgi:hypothetical protein
MQVLIGFFFAPLQTLPGLGGVSSDDLGPKMEEGAECMLGVNSLPGDACENAGVILICYVFANFLYNVYSLLITKHGSATLSVVAAAVALPLTNISFSFSFLMGKNDVEPFSVFNLFSTCVVLSGFLVYSMSDEDLGGGRNSEDGEENGEGNGEKNALLLHRRSISSFDTKGLKGAKLMIRPRTSSMIYTRPRGESDGHNAPGRTPIYNHSRSPLIATPVRISE